MLKCEGCRHWHRTIQVTNDPVRAVPVIGTGPKVGDCRRYPPRMLISLIERPGMHMTEMPAGAGYLALPGDFPACGEWAQRLEGTA